MSNSAINTQVAQLKIGNVQNQADNSAVYSGGIWSLKNSTALTSVTITDSGNVGIGTVSPANRLHVYQNAASNINCRIENASTNAGNLIQFAQVTNGSVAAPLAYIGHGGDNTGNLAIINASNTATTFATNNVERMRIDSSGNLLVGTTVANPIVSNVNGTKIFAAQGVVQSNASSNPAYEVGRYTTTGTMITFYYGGITVGNISTNGSTITFSGNALSDERWKENIQPIENALEAVLSTEFVSFEYKENKKPSAGVVAQQLQQVVGLGAFVTNGAEEADYKAVDYNAIVGYLGKAIQEQQAQIEALKAEVAALKAP